MSIQGLNSVLGLTSGYGVLQSLLGSSQSNGAGAASGSTGTSAAASTLSPRDQFTSDIQALFGAVQAGDMSAAQTALQSLETDLTGGSSSGIAATSSTSSISTDWQALIKSVNAGDASGAKSALAKLQADFASVGASHHHHHHHHGGATSSTTDAGTDVTATAEPTETSTGTQE